MLAVASAFYMWPRPDRFSKENYDRLQCGMTREEVIALLGPPSDCQPGLLLHVNQDSGEVALHLQSPEDEEYQNSGCVAVDCWETDTDTIWAGFDSAGRLAHKEHG